MKALGWRKQIRWKKLHKKQPTEVGVWGPHKGRDRVLIFVKVIPWQ